jgi:hypothetical protein
MRFAYPMVPARFSDLACGLAARQRLTMAIRLGIGGTTLKG